MRFELYSLSDIERGISNVYQENGIQCASNMNIERIASMFGIILTYYKGRSFVHYSEDNDPIIFINESLSEAEQREDFFHELCHPLRHIGCQTKMPRLFKELQEIQAAQFQLYAAMPFYLIKRIAGDLSSVNARVLATQFRVTDVFALKRVEQVMSRVNQQDIVAPPSVIESEPVSQSIRVTYPETERLLQQLYQQTAKGNIS